MSGVIFRMIERLAGANAWRRYGTALAELRRSLPDQSSYPVRIDIGPIFASPEELARRWLLLKYGSDSDRDMMRALHSWITFFMSRAQINPSLLQEIVDTERRWVGNFFEQGRADRYRGRVRLVNGFIRNIDRTDFGPPDPFPRVDIDTLVYGDLTTLKVLDLELRTPRRRQSTIDAEEAIEVELRAGVEPGSHGGPPWKEFGRTIQQQTGASKPYSDKQLSRLTAKVRNEL
jgi:hypothetical protein